MSDPKLKLGIKLGFGTTIVVGAFLYKPRNSSYEICHIYSAIRKKTKPRIIDVLS